jgi:multiple sugar transport system substrate-binding protein
MVHARSICACSAGAMACAIVTALGIVGCGERRDVLTFSGSVLGGEGAIVRRQIDRFVAAHPGLTIEIRSTPDAADQRHLLYVQWLNAWAEDPDVLQLDVIWTPEFAAAGWILPIDERVTDPGDFFEAPLAANRWNGRLYALPWFVDVGMIYRRTDLAPDPPRTLDELVEVGRRARETGRVPYGLVWQGALYEGLVTVFLEHLTAFGGRWLDDAGRVVVDSPAGVQALAFMRAAVERGLVPPAALGWQEEPVRFAFQNGRAAFMRNWPYAAALLNQPSESAVAGRFAVSPLPAAGAAAGSQASPAAALGGAQLAINARSRQPDAAWQLIAYLTAAEQMLERAQAAGQFPARRSVYADERLAAALAVAPADAREIIEHAVPRPATPVYTQLSGLLQVALHRALTGQVEPEPALTQAADEMRAVLASAGLARGGS